MAFVKVVEGSEIYNFPIHHFVHFYSTFGSFTCSNRDTCTQLDQSTPRHATPRRRQRWPRRTTAHRCLGTRASRLPEVAARLPNAPHPKNVSCSALPYGSAQCPAVRRPSFGSKRPETPQSVHRLLPGARIAYKGAAVLRLACRAACGTCACRRGPPCPPPPSRVPTSSRGRATIPIPPLGPTRARTATRVVARPRACRSRALGARHPPVPPRALAVGLPIPKQHATGS
jgi:hypothetical protein